MCQRIARAKIPQLRAPGAPHFKFDSRRKKAYFAHHQRRFTHIPVVPQARAQIRSPDFLNTVLPTSQHGRSAQLHSSEESFSAPAQCVQVVVFLIDMYAAYNRLGDTANAARLFKRLVRSERIQQSTVGILFARASKYVGGIPDAHAFAWCCGAGLLRLLRRVS
jgi:hypothetical protein